MSEHIVSYRWAGVADAAIVMMLIRIPTGYELIMGSDILVSGLFNVDLYEDPTVTAPGTALVAEDTDREKNTAANSTFFRGPTIGANGVILEMGAAEPSHGKIASRDPGPYVLKADEDYLIIATNRSGAAADVNIKLAVTEVPARP